MLGKDPETNVVTLGENEDLFSDRLVAEDLNWIACGSPVTSLSVTAKARYSQREAKAVVHPLSETQALIEFEEKQRAITPGQAVVFYDGDVVVGGGTIASK